jgi:hypothetical protein
VAGVVVANLHAGAGLGKTGLSSREERRSNRTERDIVRQLEIAEEFAERNRRIGEVMAEVGRMPSGAELAALKYAFWVERCLPHLHPVPGQRPDTALTDIIITKRSAGAMSSFGLRKFFGRTQRQYLAQGGVVADAEINCLAMAPAALAKATKRAEGRRLDQMLGHGRPVGRILHIGSDGTVIRVRMLITDQTAIAKMRAEVYSGVIAEFDESDRLHRVGLADSDHLAKGSGANIMMGTVYDESGAKMSKLMKKARRISRDTGASLGTALDALQKVQKAYAPALPRSAEAALLEKTQADDLVGRGVLDARPRQQRANQAVGIELIKAAQRNPANRIAVGDAAVINFLRHGRP